ncbi:MAG: hypothetical protein U1E12_10270 [Hydrogenophaga sp.]|uniref:hypothetical protein n=1 Tax=Hydrogenophaga sp. TaxID=1904254 RepID=UPI002ABA1F63|nr:hypothetical protein [Hydrogenophaga sp.]MDZ4102047.1 hypothetical protein [Hydrogenophaga sp.]
MGAITTTPEELQRRLDVEINKAEIRLQTAAEDVAAAVATDEFMVELARFDVKRDRLNDLRIAQRIMEEFGVIG